VRITTTHRRNTRTRRVVEKEDCVSRRIKITTTTTNFVFATQKRKRREIKATMDEMDDDEMAFLQGQDDPFGADEVGHRGCTAVDPPADP
jgi:hypothetical protein